MGFIPPLTLTCKGWRDVYGLQFDRRVKKKWPQKKKELQDAIDYGSADP